MDVTTTVTTWGALKLALQIAVHILETEEELYHTLKTAREASEHIFSTRAVIHGSQGLTKRYDTAVASSTLDAGCLEMKYATSRLRYPNIDHIANSS
jgi:hypothetical protein